MPTVIGTSPNSFAYFDAYSHQFGSISLGDKLSDLGFLISEGMSLPEVIMSYSDNHNSMIIDALRPALIYYIQQMRWGESIHVTDQFFEEMTDVELALLTEDEIKLRYMSGKVFCSCWDDSVLEEMGKRVNYNKEKFGEMIRDVELSKEFLFTSTIKK